jgi:protein-tyrosine-phosphatase/predicted ATP-grasp superfamily ATP-dependent carboligase
MPAQNLDNKPLSMPQAASQNKNILVLDGDMPHAVSIVRSLSGAGFAVEVAAHCDKPIASYSRWTKATHRYPNPLERQDDFVQWVSKKLEEGAHDLVIPVTERSMVPLSRHQADLAAAGTIAMPAPESLEIALDKDKTFSLASDLGVSIPESTTLNNTSDAEAARGVFGYPVVLKPARSVGNADGHRVQLKVEYAHSDEEYQSRVRELLRFGPVILQEYFAGEGVGVELIANQGQVEYIFQHRRLHELPLTGGGSTLRECVEVDGVLADASRSLMKALKWHGVAMVEFKHDPGSGDYRLMEINGRFWGSLPLAVSAGADFPVMLAELYFDGRVGQRPEARVGIVCRRLQTDLQWYESVLRDPGRNPLVTLPDKSTLLRDAALIFSPRHRFDLQSLRDPRPGLVEIGRCARFYWDRIVSQLRQRRLISRQESAWRDGTVTRRLQGARNVLFICYGNINRSPLAEAYFKQIHADRDVVIDSAGFHPVENRDVDPVMLEVAAENGLDLSGSSSRQVTPEMLNTADIIFVMELKHLLAIQEVCKESLSRTFILGYAAEEATGRSDIPDPYGKTRRDYKSCYDQLVCCLDSLKAKVVQ